MIKVVRYLSFFFVSTAQALVPVEGILMGEAHLNVQNDPLLRIFSDIYDKSSFGENKKAKLYHSTYLNGAYLVESCSHFTGPKYSSPWSEKQAQRSVAATLQYIGLDTTIKSIGAYAKKLEVGPESFKVLSQNLVKNYCSKNITSISLRNIERSLEHYYTNPQMNIIPSITSSPFATQAMKYNTEKPSARSKEFDLVIRNFRSFCSWGGEVEDYRMMTTFLKNPFVMGFVIKNMMGIQDKVDEKEQKVVQVTDLDSTVQVVCTELICRKENFNTFKEKFPLSLGSTGLGTDLQKLYCHHFRYQDDPKTKVPQVKQWIKELELEDPIMETSNFISLMTGIPDLLNGAEAYNEVPLMARSSIDERWSLWSKQVLGSFSKDLLYEESLKIKVEPRRDLASLQTNGFQVDFSITVGELDRLLVGNDKLGLSFDLKLSKNYLRSVLSKWSVLVKEVNEEGKKAHKEDIARYIALQLKEKEKLFTQRMWNDDFSKLIADELLQQVIFYRGSLFDSYKDEVLQVPIKFSYGLFALSYLRYRSDVAAGRF